MRKTTRQFSPIKRVYSNIFSFFGFFFSYTKIKVLHFSEAFEGKKDLLVKFFIMKRGRYNRPFLHFATMSVLGMGVLIAPILADTYPIFASQEGVKHLPSPSTQTQSVVVDQNAFTTQVSQKPRDTIIDYTVQRGDTVSTVAQKFNVSEDTIRWSNNLSNDDITAGDNLKILPVTGVAYKVNGGDTVYTIADKLHTNPQKIVDFPFNTFANPETFSLVEGQILIVPDGSISSQQAPANPTPQYIAQAPQSITFTGGGFHWPIQGDITQGFSFYHPGIDIAGPSGTPIYAAKGGTIAEATCGWDGGYGCHVVINHGDGYSTMYAHMVTQPSVSVGQSVAGGQLIGFRGSTGRSTGPHVHFEIRSSHGNVNPLAYLQ